MNHTNFSLERGKDLFIRIPDELDSQDLVIKLNGLVEGKTLQISVIDNKDAPFFEDAILADEECELLRYFGSDDYWQPTGKTRLIVDGYPECSPSDCDHCHVVSCGVYQGYTPCVPRTIGYLRAGKK